MLGKKWYICENQDCVWGQMGEGRCAGRRPPVEWVLRPALAERPVQGVQADAAALLKCHAHHSLKVASLTLRDSYEGEEALRYIFGSSVHICFLFDMFCQHFCENTAIALALEPEAAASSRSGTPRPSVPPQWRKRRKCSCIPASVLFPSPH